MHEAKHEKLVLAKNHDPELTGEPAEGTDIVSEIGDVIDKLCNPITFKTLSNSYGISVTSLYRVALLVGFWFGGLE